VFSKPLFKRKGGEDKMAEPTRVSPEEVRQKVTSGSALLVCAYDDDEKFKRVHLEDAISLEEFRSKLSTLSKDQEIVFYCA
jgi:rhodanese-related sulfurtransferase